MMRIMPTQKRWVLILSSLMVFGSAYCYDNPSALKSQLQQHFHTLPKADYEFLFSLAYSLYSVPNMLLPFFGGMLVDKFGVRAVALACAILLLLGQMVVACGSAMSNFYVILAGRVLFGLGGETMWVAQSSFVTLWFDSSDLAFAFGVNTLFARLGTVINDKLSPKVADDYSATTALWLGSFFCLLSLVCTIVLVALDRRVEIANAKAATAKFIAASSNPEPPPMRLQDLFTFSRSFWLIACKYVAFYACLGPFNNVASSLLLERDFFKVPPVACQRCGVGEYTRYCDAISPRCPSAPPFAWPLPHLAKNCSIQTPFDQYRCSKSPPYIQDDGINCDDIAWRQGPFTARYCQTKSQAAEAATSAMSLTPLIVAFVAPLSGTMIDLVGLRPLLALVAECLVLAAHLCLTFTTVQVHVALTLLGFGACVFSSSMWPCIPYVVETRFVGTAFGAITAFSNCGLAIVPLVVAAVYNASGGRYIPSTEYVFIACAGTTLGLGVLLNMVDVGRGHVLNRRVLVPIPTSFVDLNPDTDLRDPLLVDSN
ncbi:Aste57867_3548 [Aphanomyces stellatus]|uniref:Lysosomal dipeptide transporter MFSD1 n=1 Tax=Aphanomyces stellatus TaxID=120398 RepID=A0A485KCC3_9STRA|nr:hypothetical protein As57867_003537 [Aphanomyces stellatus]VFT80711.1 Aste57867_3548 [Aphanomyces stellatus]